MKRFLFIFMILVLFSSMCVVADEADTSETGAWRRSFLTDEFGDLTEEFVYKTVIKDASFSNTATTNHPMEAVINYYPNDGLFGYGMLPYGQPATYLENSVILLKAKVNDTVYQSGLDRRPPNGILTMPEYFAENDVSVDKDADGSTHIGYNQNRTYLTQLLMAGYDVKCVLYIDSATYNFTIPSKGFKELVDEDDPEKGEAYEKAEGLMEEGRYTEAFYAFLEYPDYKDNKVKAAEALSKSGTWIDIDDSYKMQIPEDWKPYDEIKKENYHQVLMVNDDSSMFLSVLVGFGNYVPTEELVNVESDEHPDATLVDLNGILVVNYISYNSVLEATWTAPDQKSRYFVSVGNNDSNSSEMDATQYTTYGLIMNTVQKK